MTQPAQTPKPKRKHDAAPSLLDVLMPRMPATRYGSQWSPEDVIKTIKALDNRKSRIVTIMKKPTPQGVVYKFNVEFREFKEVPKDARWNSRLVKDWVVISQIDGTVTETAAYPSVMAVTPQRIPYALWSLFSAFFCFGFIAIMDFSPTLKTLILVTITVSAAFGVLAPYRRNAVKPPSLDVGI